MKKIIFTLIILLSFNIPVLAISVPSNNAILLDQDSGRVLYSKI